MMTQNCIVCYQEAKLFTGHVKRGNESITAGWCKNHIHKSNDMSIMINSGFCGEWKTEFGIRENFKQIG